MRVALLLGGRSAEREVSLRTGAAVADALRRLGHDVVEVDAGTDLPLRLAGVRPEASFVALHGRWGEDGTVQGMLEIMGIPYTGSGVLASSLAMDKALSKVVLRSAGIPTPDFQVLARGQGPEAIELEPPYVVKPPREGSTLGIRVIRDTGESPSALDAARKYDHEVLVEKFVAGREITVGVLEGEGLPLVEIVPRSGFYDYEAKYTPGCTEYRCPAPLPEEAAAEAGRIAVLAYRALGCDGAARVDLMLDGGGNPWVLEANTIPGMTPTSLLPKAAAAAGLSFDALVGRILSGASLKI